MTTTTAPESPMFRETVTNADGSTSQGTCTEAHALTLLRIATRRGYRIEATRNGGVIISRDVFGAYVPRKHTVTLEPVAQAGRISDTTRLDLTVIDRRPASLVGERIHAAFYSCPPATTARLIKRGLVTIDGTAVSVSLSARLAMLAQDHRATASTPRGYHHQDGVIGPWRKGGCINDRSSVASCSCRWSKSAGDVDDARRYAREHRQDVTAAMIPELLARVNVTGG